MKISRSTWLMAAAVSVATVLVAGSPANATTPAPSPPATTQSTSSGSSFPTFPSFPAFPTFPTFPGSPPVTPATATLSGNTLTVTGGAADDIVSIAPRDIVTNSTSAVRGGTTSVGLDPAALRAAGLTLTGANTPGRPAAADFQAGFPIVPATDFRYTPSPFAPASGVIRHTGTITFNGSITVGNFDIGFNPARATGGRSGFFVASTTGLKGILFDLGAPSSVSSALNRLAIGSTPLLISPEFATILSKPTLSGAVAGKARIDALSTPASGGQIAVTLSSGFGDPFRTVLFPAAQVKNLVIATGAGRNNVNVIRLDLSGELRFAGGAGADTVLISEVISGGLRVETAAGNDLVNLSSDVVLSTVVDLGTENDTATVQGTLLTGTRAINGGAGFDAANLYRTDVTRAALTGFEGISG